MMNGNFVTMSRSPPPGLPPRSRSLAATEPLPRWAVARQSQPLVPANRSPPAAARRRPCARQQCQRAVVRAAGRLGRVASCRTVPWYFWSQFGPQDKTFEPAQKLLAIQLDLCVDCDLCAICALLALRRLRSFPRLDVRHAQVADLRR